MKKAKKRAVSPAKEMDYKAAQTELDATITSAVGTVRALSHRLCEGRDVFVALSCRGTLYPLQYDKFFGMNNEKSATASEDGSSLFDMRTVGKLKSALSLANALSAGALAINVKSRDAKGEMVSDAHATSLHVHLTKCNDEIADLKRQKAHLQNDIQNRLYTLTSLESEITSEQWEMEKFLSPVTNVNYWDKRHVRAGAAGPSPQGRAVHASSEEMFDSPSPVALDKTAKQSTLQEQLNTQNPGKRTIHFDVSSQQTPSKGRELAVDCLRSRTSVAALMMHAARLEDCIRAAERRLLGETDRLERAELLLQMEKAEDESLVPLYENAMYELKGISTLLSDDEQALEKLSAAVAAAQGEKEALLNKLREEPDKMFLDSDMAALNNEKEKLRAKLSEDRRVCQLLSILATLDVDDKKSPMTGDTSRNGFSLNATGDVDGMTSCDFDVEDASRLGGPGATPSVVWNVSNNNNNNSRSVSASSQRSRSASQLVSASKRKSVSPSQNRGTPKKSNLTPVRQLVRGVEMTPSGTPEAHSLSPVRGSTKTPLKLARSTPKTDGSTKRRTLAPRRSMFSQELLLSSELRSASSENDATTGKLNESVRLLFNSDDDVELAMHCAQQPVLQFLSTREKILIVSAHLFKFREDTDYIEEVVNGLKSNKNWTSVFTATEESNVWRTRVLEKSFNDVVEQINAGKYHTQAPAATELIAALKYFCVVYNVFEAHVGALIAAVMAAPRMWGEAETFLSALETAESLLQTKPTPVKKKKKKVAT